MGRRSNVHELKLRQNWVETADDNECVWEKGETEVRDTSIFAVAAAALFHV